MADQVSSPAEIGIGDLLQAGLHFGHQTKRWNPKMKRFIFDKRNGIYVIDLAKTLFHLKQALQFVQDVVANGKRVVFVGTKRLTQELIREAATRCGQFYVIHRWLGGTLTNHQNIKTSIAHMRKLEALKASGATETMPQKEVSRLRSELERLQRSLGGIADMTAMPGALIVIDINREAIAVQEANRMGIPVVALVDTNCDPDPIDYPIPGNDDALRCNRLIVNLFADAVVKGQALYKTAAVEQVAQAANAGEKHEVKAARPRDKRRTRAPRVSAPAAKPPESAAAQT